MSRQILINSGIFETRVAILEGGQLVDFYAERGSGIVGNVYKGRVENVLPGMDAAFVNIGLSKNAFLYVSNIVPEVSPPSPGSKIVRPRPITELVKEGQEILVQVERASIGSKGPRVSTRLSLPGRFVVLIGPDARHIGVSRRIEDPQERHRLRALGEKFCPPHRALIMRTEAEGATEEEIRQDLEYLLRLWEEIHEKAQRLSAPALIYQDASIIYRICRDFFTAEVDRVIVDHEEDYRQILDIMDSLDPALKERVKLHPGERPLFLEYDLERELEKVLQREVPLASGGYLTIDETEAITAIDVNTGRYVGTTRLADTILTTNLEAAEEIARQLRLRDIGGIIIVDFIDMERIRDRVKVYSALERALERDRARTKIVHVSPLALVEITRKRTGNSLVFGVSEPCPGCQGRGRVLSAESLAIRAEHKLAEAVFLTSQPCYLMRVHVEVADWLVGPKGETAELLEEKIGRPLYIRVRDDNRRGDIEIIGGSREEIEGQLKLLPPGTEITITPQDKFISECNGPLAIVNGLLVKLPENCGLRRAGRRLRLREVKRSFAIAQLA